MKPQERNGTGATTCRKTSHSGTAANNWHQVAPQPSEQGGTVKPIDESYLAWMKDRKEPFTSEDAAKHFGVSRTTAAERLRVLTGLGYVTATKHPVRFNQLLYTYKEFSWHDPFNLAGKL
jgi:hypothetical protein